MSFGFVIGNGISRTAVPAKMYDKKDTWACNLAYRDFTPANLICCDRHITVSAVSAGMNTKCQMWTRDRWFGAIEMPGVKPLPSLPFPIEIKHDREMDWGSGTYAAYLAALSEHDIIVMIGFDLWGTKDRRVNNVFAGEEGYGPKDAAPVGSEGWIHQFGRIFAHFPDKQFVFLNEDGWEAPDAWSVYDNFNKDELRQLKNL